MAQGHLARIARRLHSRPTAANKAAFKQNGKVRLADGQVRTIKAIYFSGAHMSLMLDGAKLNANTTGHPKSITALSGSTAPSTPALAPGTGNATHSSAINNFTNSDWLNGVWRKSAGVSVPATAANRSAFKAGASVKLADGQLRSISAIYISGNNMSVMLKGATIGGNLGYPNKLFAATGTSVSRTPTPETPPPSATKPPLTIALNAFTGENFANGVYLTSPVSP